MIENFINKSQNYRYYSLFIAQISTVSEDEWLAKQSASLQAIHLIDHISTFINDSYLILLGPKLPLNRNCES